MKNHRLFDKIDISFLNPYDKGIDLQNVKKEIEKMIPASLFSEIDIIYVGKFDFLDDDHLNSKFMDNAIYLSNSAYYDSDVVFDIVSGLAESIEKKYMHLFYNNEDIVRELKQYLEDEGLINAVCDFFIEDRILMKEKMPALSGVLEEIIEYGSC